MFSCLLPMFVNFIFGCWDVKMEPGLIFKFSVYVSFVSSFIMKFFSIVRF